MPGATERPFERSNDNHSGVRVADHIAGSASARSTSSLEQAASAATWSLHKSELPELLDRVLAQLERGNLQVWARTPDADALMQRLERLAARINATILAAACVVGLAIVMLVYRTHGWQAWIGVVFWIVVVGATAAVARALWRLRK
jgi:hypothetical protein